MTANEFIFHLGHEALKYVRGEHKFNSKHVKWVGYLQSFDFTIKHKSSKLNQGTDALSRRHLLLFYMDACVLGFEHLKSLYASDEDFKELYSACLKNPKEDFLIQGGNLFKGMRWYIPKCETRELLIRKVHRGLVGI